MRVYMMIVVPGFYLRCDRGGGMLVVVGTTDK